MKKLRKRYSCPVELATDVLGGKWKTVILARLKERHHRYGELRSKIPGLSDKILTERLSELEALGFIERRQGKNNTQGLSYQMTRRGKMMQPALKALYKLGEELSDQLSIEIGN